MFRDLLMPMLVGDLGGTNARFGVMTSEGISHVRVLAADDYPLFEDAFAAYLSELNDTPKMACLAIAAPITGGDRVAFTNRGGWSLSTSQLKEMAGFERLEVINDFKALAMSIPYLGPHDIFNLGPEHTTNRMDAPKVILGPGTGLGVASLAPSPAGWIPIPGEGGHTAFSALDLGEDSILAAMRERHGRVTWEHILSGPGLENLYQAMIDTGEVKASPRTAAQITGAAMEGDVFAEACIKRFCGMLGSFAGDLALTLGARGGVYIGGGIVPRIRDLVEKSDFRNRFEEKGRMTHFVKDISTQLIIAEHPALIGAAAWLDTLSSRSLT